MRLMLSMLMLALAGCTPTPDSYPIPPQHSQVTAPEPTPLHSFILMADPRADAFILSGIAGLEGNRWRWTTESSQVRLHVLEAREMDSVLDFTVPEVTFKQTGPLRLQVFVNGQFVGKDVVISPGEKSLRLPVPDVLLKANSDNDLMLKIENPWIAPSDGAKLGVLLRAAGFLKHK